MTDADTSAGAVNVQLSVEIDRSADDVFTFVANFENGPRWQHGVRSVRWTSPPPIGTSSTFEQTARFAGRPVVSSFRVTAFDNSERRASITTTGGTFPITVTRRVEARGAQGARYTEEIVGEPRGALRGLRPLVRGMVRRTVRRDQVRLKRLLEADA